MNPHRHLNRKSWVDASFEAMKTLSGQHCIAKQPMWTKPCTDFEPKVEIRFNRECRNWPDGQAQAACSAMFQEIGGDKALLVATDGSFDPVNTRAGWGFAVFQHGRKIMEDCGAH